MGTRASVKRFNIVFESVLIWVLAASAAPQLKAETFLFDNLGATPCCEGPIASGFPYADSFSTGASIFAFRSVTVALLAPYGAPPSGLTITALLLADSSISPGSVLEAIGTISENSITPFVHGQYTFTSTSPYTLAPNTRYWIELTSNDTAGPIASVQWDSSPDLSGTIGLGGQYWASDVGNNVFDVFADGTNGGPLLMSVPGTSAVPEPPSSLLLLGAAMAAILAMKVRKSGAQPR